MLLTDTGQGCSVIPLAQGMSVLANTTESLMMIS